jgi:hypothetical protein
MLENCSFFFLYIYNKIVNKLKRYQSDSNGKNRRVSETQKGSHIMQFLFKLCFNYFVFKIDFRNEELRQILLSARKWVVVIA